MLKVVGASWEQTRMTQFLLIVVMIIAVFAIFFYEASPKNLDGNYAATAYWSEKAGFRIEFWGQNNDPRTIKQHAARAYYRPHNKDTGWAMMEIETNEKYNDSVQARAAGILEGSLSWQLIFWHWQNTVGDVCSRRADFCAEIKGILQTNYDKCRAYATQYEHVDPYWYQVNLFYIQLEALHEGWEMGKKRSRSHVDSIDFVDFLWMNHVNDIRDLELKLTSENASHPYNPAHPPSDMAVLMYSPHTDSKFLLAHQTSGLYSEMLRMMKKYTFHYHQTVARAKVVPGTKISFTSYPGAIHSQDDFYQINGKSRLQVVGSRLKVQNHKAWKHLHLKTIFMGVRVSVANRLAKTAEEWAKHVGQYNSGTGNKEWLVVDHETPEPKVWSVEQVPGLINKQDITDDWKQGNGYWISCGIPHTDDILERSGLTSSPMGKRDFAYIDGIRQILEDGIDEVTNTDSLHALMVDPEIVRRARGDLLDLKLKNEESDRAESPSTVSSTETGGIFQKQPLPGKILPEKLSNDIEISRDRGPELRMFNGIIDTKIVYDLFNFKAVAGPLYSTGELTIPPFQWSKLNPYVGNLHLGQPDTWDFEPTHPEFVW